LANIYMHRYIKAFRKYGLDRRYGAVLVTYADDFVVLCRHDAAEVLDTIRRWMASIGLALNEDKTRVCNARRESFDFLGYTFRGRRARGRRGFFVGFLPAISGKAKKAVGGQIRDWHLRSRSGADLSGLAEEINPQVRGWISYYGAYYRSGLHFLGTRIDAHVHRWALHKFKRLRSRPDRAQAWLAGVRKREPRLFAHWHLIAYT